MAPVSELRLSSSRRPSGVYLETLRAIARTSFSESGGLHRRAFSASSAASMLAWMHPLRRIAPAIRASVSLRWPGGIGASEPDSVVGMGADKASRSQPGVEAGFALFLHV
jgi:hypothetical protein